MKIEFLLFNMVLASTSIVSFWDELKIYNGTDLVATQIMKLRPKFKTSILTSQYQGYIVSQITIMTSIFNANLNYLKQLG